MNKTTNEFANIEDLLTKRSMARLIAIQVFYQYEFHDKENDIFQIMDNLIDNYAGNHEDLKISSYRDKVDLEFLRTLLSGVLLFVGDLDKKISASLSKNQDLSQIPDVVLNILRFGAFELCFMKDNPFKVVINEYVNIASSFYEKAKVDLINAVLEKIHQNS